MTNTPGAPTLATTPRFHDSTPEPRASSPRFSSTSRATRCCWTAHEAMAFWDMVIAVRTAPRRAWSIRNATDARRSPARGRVDRLAATLRAAWGVAPTDRRWGDRLAREHLFSVGNDPFGYLSASFGATLPFHVSDAIKRNEVFASTAETTRDAAALLDAVATFADGERALGPDAHAEFVGRWASMEHKRERAMASRHGLPRVSFRGVGEDDLLAAARLVEDAAGASTRRLSVSRTWRRRTRRRRRSRGMALGVWAIAAVRGNLEVVESTGQRSLMTGRLDATNLSVAE